MVVLQFLKRKENKIVSTSEKHTKYYRKKSKANRLSVQEKKAKLTTKRLVVFRKKVKSSYFGDSFGTAKIESVNKF